MLARQFFQSFADTLHVSGLRPALVWLVRVARVFLFPRRAHRVLSVLGSRAGDLKLPPRDRFFFVEQEHYLSRRFSVKTRLDTARAHYVAEANLLTASQREAVYQQSGLQLWRTERAGHVFAIHLTPPNDNRYEGNLSVVLSLAGARIGVMSFSYVDSRIFGHVQGTLIFVTRSQAGRDPTELATFRGAFKQNSPHYFCLAALSGMAEAHGMRRLAAVKFDAQPAFQPQYASSFLNSYSKLWESFGAVEADAQASFLAVPLEPTALSEIKGKHRARAIERRTEWASVSASAAASIAHELRPALVRHATAAAQGAASLAGLIFGTLQAAEAFA
jgi:uncharacterized protein VirK/YbjX